MAVVLAKRPKGSLCFVSSSVRFLSPFSNASSGRRWGITATTSRRGRGGGGGVSWGGNWHYQGDHAPCVCLKAHDREEKRSSRLGCGGGISWGGHADQLPRKESTGNNGAHRLQDKILSVGSENLSYMGDPLPDVFGERDISSLGGQLRQENRSGSVSTSGNGVNWDADAKNYRKIQAAVAKKASRMPHRPLPAWYSLEHSTEQNYCSDEMKFYGPFSHIRQTLDYTFHSNYTKQRQKFQDSIILRRFVAPIINDVHGDTCSTPTNPWVVFTAGPMGAGKGHTLRKLNEERRFPLHSFVKVDPDEIRRDLPEFVYYVENDPASAGDHTRKEAGYLSEITTLMALQAGKNVIVDGSLRNHRWYNQYFSRLREEFPGIRIAIVQVSATREAILQWAAKRALKSGRYVPLETLENAMFEVPKAINILAPQADFFCELHNVPDRANIEIRTEGVTWDSFEKQWEQTCAWIPGRLRNRTMSRVDRI